MSATYAELGFALHAHKFARERLAFEVDPRQKTVFQSSAYRMILNYTCQWGKSTVRRVKALHRPLTKPEALVIIAGPGERQTGEFLRKISTLLYALNIKLLGDGYNDSSLRLPNSSRILVLPPNARASPPPSWPKSAKCWASATSTRNICASSTPPTTRYSKKTPSAGPSPATPSLSSPTESENANFARIAKHNFAKRTQRILQSRARQ